MADSITIARPDDFHVHLRDGEMMESVVGATARQFARGIVMPNLKPPVTQVEAARSYRDRILAAVPRDASFEPLMTLYLTDDTPAEEISRAKLSGRVFGVKLYPAGATTNSAEGVTRLSRCFHTLEKMEERFPIAITRDLDAAKEWVRDHARGSERYGLVASSKAQRLKPHAMTFVSTSIRCIGF